MKRTASYLATALLLLVTGSPVWAGPTSIVWIPSVDVQPFKTMDLGINNFFRASGDVDAPPNRLASRDANTLDLSLTFGLLPFKAVQMEVGVDYVVIANDPNDQHPWSGNAKLAITEEALLPHAPALAVGVYNGRPAKDIATNDAPYVASGQNIVYGLAAKTVPALGPLPTLGRFSVGYYRGSRRALIDEAGRVRNHGVLLSWDRTLKEISENLWLGLDYMGGRNSNGSFNVGFSWAFARNVNLLFGYDMYTHSSLAGSNTLTLQFDIKVPD
ncbi:hypothetical protein GMLC_33610 [Geomonas limicola]|uniref:Transporter n=1 Tax=Geomonas limicola TaxID=2740186 RepID=A0A6V8NAY0_9BACT|nr:hypothetical protein [Geomonas limicola]GFO69782.1 hypothetical protein GMLC_33610 [Geomonas limicola]